MPASQYPLFNWLKERSAGVLFPVFCLPGDLGIGTLGAEARSFCDFLANSGVKYWQICPLGPTGFGDSPYQAFSAFAGNPYFIDLHELVNEGLLNLEDLKSVQELTQDKIDYGELYKVHKHVLNKAAMNFEMPDFNPHWLPQYATFRAFKDYFKDRPWFEWPIDYRNYKTAIRSDLYTELKDQIEIHSKIQAIFYKQLKRLKEYAHGLGIKIIGDIPLYVAPDSADIWAHPDRYAVDEEGIPTHVGGVPPDYFCEKGQLWGNPVYNWNVHEKEGFTWWVELFRWLENQYDVVRIDHFRGFESYWSIPADAPDARTGKWEKGPGIPLFKAIQQKLPNSRLILEDSGMSITHKVHELRDQTGFPGIAFLQFGFDCNPENTSLPANLKINQVVHTGTHDSNTTKGWYKDIPGNYRDQVNRYFNTNGENISLEFTKAALGSVSNLSVITVCDLLDLDSDARINIPGTVGGNWRWRLNQEQMNTLKNEIAPKLRDMLWLHNR